MRQLGKAWTNEASDSPETEKILTPDPAKGLGGLETGAWSGIVSPYDGHDWQPKHRTFDLSESVTASREVPVYVRDKSTHQDTPIVVTATVCIDRIKTSRAKDPDLVELKLQISIEKSRLEKAAGADVTRADKAGKESPAVIKALSELIVDVATKSVLEKLKEGLPAADDKFHLILAADVIDDLNKQLHQLFGTSAEAATVNIADLPPELANVVGGTVEKLPFSHDDPVDSIVKPLRITGIAIDILSGGLPVAEILDFLFDSIKKAFADSLCEALTPQSQRSEAQVNSPSSGNTQGPTPELFTVNTSGDFGTKYRVLEKGKDLKPPRRIIKDEQSLERPREARERRDEVLILTAKQAPRDSDHLLCQTSRSQELDEPPSILVGRDDEDVVCVTDEPPSIAAGQQLTTGGAKLPPEKKRSKMRKL